MATKNQEQTATFTVTDAVLHDGDLYQAGEQIELTERQARALHARGVLALPTAAEADAPAAGTTSTKKGSK